MEDFEPKKPASEMTDQEIRDALGMDETETETEMTEREFLEAKWGTEPTPAFICDALTNTRGRIVRVTEENIDEVLDCLARERRREIAAIPPEEQQRIVERGIEASRRRQGMVH